MRFPSKESFFNKLDDKTDNAEHVWNTFRCKNFRDYHDLYLKSDVLLLTDFIEKFQRMCMCSYGVDAAHYCTTSGMAWDAALKLTKVKLQLFGNEEMYTFIECSIRGGISQIF